MPRLTKLRLINVGHPKARFDDVTIPFHDQSRRPIDSTLWLRNGGGKSSILNLFFSLLQPNRRQFLGKAGQSDRLLEDYVLPETRGVVVAEWQLDVAKDDLPQWFLTGAFYEWNPRDPNTLERLFFASRVQGAITLDRLPLQDERGRALTMHGFKQAWQNLTTAHPSAEAHETHLLQEWQGMLDKRRIDPDLFGYQRVMNAREGGAEDLFRFRESDAFVNFFLDLAMNPEHGQGVAKNLTTYSESLKKRLEQHLPGLELIRALLPHVQEIQSVSAERHLARVQLGELAARLELLHTYAQRRRAEAEAAVVSLAARLEEAKQEKKRLGLAKQEHQDHATALERLRLTKEAGHFKKESEGEQARYAAADQAQQVWRLAPSLLEVERSEGRLRTLEALLQRENEALKPEWADVRVAARQLAGALVARAEARRAEAGQKRLDAEALEQTVQHDQKDAKGARNQASRAAQRAINDRQKLDKRRLAIDTLRQQGTLEPDEPLAEGLTRWQEQQAATDFSREALRGERRLLEDQAQAWTERRLAAESQERLAEDRHHRAGAELEDARGQRDALTLHPMLSRALMNDPDLDTLSPATARLLRSQRTDTDQRRLDVQAQLTEEERILEHLHTRSLLPPARDVVAVRAALEEASVRSWSGWDHVAQIETRAKAQEFIERAPELVRGVLVLDRDLDRAKTALLSAALTLDAPVVVAARTPLFRATLPEGTQRFVVGPTSDAHFDEEAGRREALVREQQLETLRARSDELQAEGHELRELSDRLDTYLQRYPQGFFETQEAEVTASRQAWQAAQAHLSELAGEQNVRRARQQQLEQQLEQAQTRSRLILEQTSRLKVHLELYGDEAQATALELSIFQDEADVRTLERQADETERRSKEQEAHARQLRGAAQELDQAAAAALHEARAVAYLEGALPTPTADDVDACRERHSLLCGSIDQKTQGHALKAELQAAQDNLQATRTAFQQTCPPHIPELEVRAALETLDDKGRLQQRIQDIEWTRDAALSAKERMMQTWRSVQTQLEHHQGQYVQLKRTLEPDEQALDSTSLWQRVQAAKRKGEEASAALDRLEERLEQMEKASKAAEEPRRLWTDHQITLRQLLDRYDDLLKERTAAAQTAGEPPADQGFAAHVENLASTLHKQQNRWHDLRGRQETAGRAFDRTLAGSTIKLAKKLSDWSSEDLEQSADQVYNELDLRRRTIEASLEDADKHRELLITETLSLAERGTGLLKSLSSNSVLPEGAGTLSGQRFLKITLPAPLPQSERRALIGNLLNDMVRDQTEFQGPDLVQRAVRKLAHPIRVEVLFPDVDAPPKHLPITMMAKESGGERLTSAVLLYCALARQRARERAQVVSAQPLSLTGTLILDNPVGASSRVKLLTLQRDMARAMSIQLIYATGVQDLEAVRTMPNVVQLRNEKRHTGTGHSLVEVVRLGRIEQEPGDE
ncbi:hypothetical protein K7W42_16250 [Deinococcus sp. HMF7604]|uniref:hypothetical protein n=1 Tax=Deinococcus betulae TaxID=2873312 RepID=UPI001CCDC886|nr:hypothetical protein [Deinococcus betulae]MBZ9752401.1 hypothetical protein [Deinococcus betulae]